LSLKQLQDDPWNTLAQRFSEGQTVGGKVTKLASFGAFVEIEPGVEALLPTAEMSDHNAKPEEVVEVGQDIQAIIKRFRPDEKRISLSLRDISGGGGGSDHGVEEDEE
ncbi:MAG: S1 RNA-binding domain-containing protein, partial [Candidatus Sericytochromatia bacterium]|nr:S1 RNA-binding domain-containing protein [Candidatus Tanganyikabacteria bacterium]